MAWSASGIKSPMLDIGEPPKTAEHIWFWFHEIRARVGGGGFGLNPISYQDIEAWMRITGIVADRWEIKAILAIDDVFLTEANKEKPRGD